MINTEKLKPFILHKNRRVRSEVLHYFNKGYIQDEQIVSLSLQAGEKYGFKENLYLLHGNNNQKITRQTCEQLMNICERSDDELVKMHSINLMDKCCDIKYLKELAQEQSNRELPDCFKTAKYRLKYNDIEHDDIWKQLREFAYENSNVEYYSQVETAKSNAMIEMLAKGDWMYDEIIASELERFYYMEIKDPDQFEKYWLWVAFLIQLAGQRKTADAIENINNFMKIDSDVFQSESVEALSRIAAPEVIRLIESDFVNESWDYQLFATDVLGKVKIKQSEEAVLRLLQKKTEYQNDIFGMLCFALCDLFSNQAFKWGKTIIGDIEILEHDDIKERLITLAKIFDYNLPEAKKWKSQCANDRRRLAKARKLAMIAKALDKQEYLGDDYDDYGLEQDFNNKSYFNDTSKTGRNDPCFCGSGKKYKKCCGK